MMYKLTWTELSRSELTNEEMGNFYDLMEQYMPYAIVRSVGNDVNGRRLCHGIGSIEFYKAMFAHLDKERCSPLLVAIKKKEGINYGYKKRLIEIDEKELKSSKSDSTYEIVRDENIELVSMHPELKADHLKPIESVDEDAKPIMVSTPDHNFAGWEQ